MTAGRIPKDLKRKSLTREEILERLVSAGQRRDEAERMKEEADREIAELTAVARARDLVPLSDMTDALGVNREFVAWLQRRHNVGSIASLRRAMRRKAS